MNFLDLPIEIRDLVYTAAVQDTTSIPKHPCQDLPPHSHMKIWASLLLTSRQVKEDIAELFHRLQYAERLRFFFDNVPTLYDFATKWRDHPLISNVPFYLRMEPFDGYRAKREGVREDMWRLLTTQPGYHDAETSSRVSGCPPLIRYIFPAYQETFYVSPLLFPNTNHWFR